MRRLLVGVPHRLPQAANVCFRATNSKSSVTGFGRSALFGRIVRPHECTKAACGQQCRRNADGYDNWGYWRRKYN